MNTKKRSLNCWAAASNLKCNGELTKEHVVSKSILELFGHLTFDFPEKKYTLGSNSYVMRNLCKLHNNALSRYDSEALKLFSSWKRFIESNPELESPETITVNGHWIERWFAKTFLSASLFDKKVMRSEERLLAPSSHSILPSLYEEKIFEPPFGVYKIKPESPLSTAKHLWSMSPQFKEVWHYTNSDHKWWQCYAPIIFHCHFGGFEIVGFFNLTQASDKDALNSFLKPMHEYLQTNAEYRNIRLAVGKSEPTKIIQAIW